MVADWNAAALAIFDKFGHAKDKGRILNSQDSSLCSFGKGLTQVKDPPKTSILSQIIAFCKWIQSPFMGAVKLHWSAAFPIPRVYLELPLPIPTMIHLIVFLSLTMPIHIYPPTIKQPPPSCLLVKRMLFDRIKIRSLFARRSKGRRHGRFFVFSIGGLILQTLLSILFIGLWWVAQVYSLQASGAISKHFSVDPKWTTLIRS